MSERVLIGPTSAFAEGEQREIRAGKQRVLVLKHRGEVYALRNVCTHESFPLLGGEVEGGAITCAQHGARFDLQTGRALCLPAIKAVRTFPVETEAGLLYLRVEP